MSFGLYLIGFLLFIGGIAWLLTTMGISQTYVVIACLILLGAGIFTGVTRTRSKDPSS
jgi:hypothetical protein